MINTNLFFNFSGFEKSPTAPVELSDAETKPEDFAAFFSVPVFSPPIIAPVKTDEIKSAEPNAVGQINQIIFAGENQANQIFQLKNDAAQINFSQPKSEVFDSANTPEQSSVFENQLVPNSVGENFKQPVVEPAKAEFQIFSGSQIIGDDGFDVKIRQPFVSPVPLISNFVEPAENTQTNFKIFTGEQKLVETNAPNAYSENKEKPNQTEIKTANIEIEINAADKFPAPSFDNFLTSVSAEFISPMEAKTPVNFVKKFFSQIPTLPAAPEIVKVKSPGARLADVRFFNGATKPKSEISGGEISSLLKTENYLKTNFKLDFTNIQSSFKAFEPKIYNEAENVFEQPKLNLPIEEQPLLKSAPENLSGKSSTEKSGLALPTLDQENLAADAPILLDEIQKNVKPENAVKPSSAFDFNDNSPILKRILQPQIFSQIGKKINRQTSEPTQKAESFTAQEDSEKNVDFGKPKPTELFSPMENKLPPSLKQAAINQISTKTDGEKLSETDAKFAEENPFAVKEKIFGQSKAASLLTGEKKIIEPTKANAFSGTEPDSTQSETVKIEKQNGFETNSGGRFFENFLKSVAKNPAAIESSPLNDLQEKVFAQIEPKLLELVNRTKEVVEKQVMKLRLNPDELGAVEVTVKKSDSGVVSAHFQTETEAARQILHEGLDQLRNSLENSGLKIGNLEISTGLFSSNGNSPRENQPQKFGSTENQSVAAMNSDGNLNTKAEDDQNRLVSLRA